MNPVAIPLGDPMEMSHDLPEELQFSVAMVPLLIGQLEKDVERKRDYVEMIQRSLDGKTCAVACGVCFRSLCSDGTLTKGPSREVFSGTRTECDEFAAQRGWTVDTEAQSHTCPDCAKIS